MALIALVIGRQTAGRVMPARWAMREADFEVLLRLVERLGGGERGGARGGLGGGPGRGGGGGGAAGGGGGGGARGGAADRGSVRRGAALPALRRREVAALGVRQRAAPLSLPSLPQDLQHADRHLPGAAAQEGVLAALRRGARGGHEPDQGGRPLRRAPDDELPLAAPVPARAGGGARGPGRRGRGGRDLLSPVPQGLPPMAPWRRPARAATAPARRAKRGLSAEQVPALIARDRAGHTADAVLPDLGAEAIGAALAPVVADDAVLCSDGAKAYAAFAAERGIRHEPINVAAGVRVRDGAFHVQNVNAYTTAGRRAGWAASTASRRATCRTISAGDGPWSGRPSRVPRELGSWPPHAQSQQPTRIEPFRSSSSSSLTVRPLTPAIGALVEGLDLATPLEPSAVAAVGDALVT